MLKIQGISPIIATPFTDNGDVDYDSLRNLLKALINGGCHALTLFGIAGEYYKLNDDERRTMVKVVVEECQKAGTPSIISITDHATELAVKQAKYLESQGADCLMLLPPFFLKPSADALYAHMKKVGEAVKIPVMVQYAPEQTGVAIAPNVFARLTNEVENIIYYKIECKPVGSYITNLLCSIDNKGKIFVGNAGYQFIEAFDRGAIGAMPGCSMYDVYLQMYNAYIAGNREEAIAVHNQLLPMLNHIRQNVEMIIHYEKKILKRRGIIESDYCRKPGFVADDYHDSIFEEYYAKMAGNFHF
ncbi:MAG TPA: dihydrodipicolinate synthase family protein [Armatimonadota bacterium]|nr:dihydrodipicolinate synthase family protein [Armatimonadota bacterium]